MTADFIASLHSVSLPLGIEFLPLFRGFVMVLFVLASLILMLVVLIQEGKGGGIAGAFGGAAAETFGVKAGSVNRFTAILAAVFMGLALLHAGLASSTPTSVIAPAAPAPVVVPPGVAPEAPPPVPPVAPPTPTEVPMDGGGAPPATPAAMGGETPPPTPAAMGGETPPAPAGMDTPPPAPETPAPAGMN